MDFSRRTAQLLHEDHQATISVLQALDQMIANARRSVPDTSNPSVLKALQAAANTIENEVSEHFTFEEDELFTRLEELGDVGIGEHLRSEHRVMLPLGNAVAQMAADALENGFTDQTWPPFRNSAGELIERMFAHIQKEEMALLPALDDILDAETDMNLSTAYAEKHG